MKSLNQVNPSADNIMADCDTLRASLELRALKGFNMLNSKGKGKSTYYVPGKEISTPPLDLSTPPLDKDAQVFLGIPNEILKEIRELKQREHDSIKIKSIIKKLCFIKSMKSLEIAGLFGKRENYFKRKYLSSMIGNKELKYLHPEMINHPEQAYLTNNTN